MFLYKVKNNHRFLFLEKRNNLNQRKKRVTIIVTVEMQLGLMGSRRVNLCSETRTERNNPK